MNGQLIVYETLEKWDIPYQYHEHPEAPTIEIAKQYWENIDARHCKNLFFRNHKGNKHFLVVIDCEQNLSVHELEKRLKQGKLSFASEIRMEKYLGLKPGSVSVFGLINDIENHVHVFIDINLTQYSNLSFHPNVNTASLVISQNNFNKFLINSGNNYEYITMY
jgi:Ala-tRNA(Pro) deacylase